MNRRDFFKRVAQAIGLAAVAPLVAPKAKAEPPPVSRVGYVSVDNLRIAETSFTSSGGTWTNTTHSANNTHLVGSSRYYQFLDEFVAALRPLGFVEQVRYRFGDDRLIVWIIVNNADEENRYAIYDKEYTVLQYHLGTPVNFKLVERYDLPLNEVKSDDCITANMIDMENGIWYDDLYFNALDAEQKGNLKWFEGVPTVSEWLAVNRC